MLLGLLALALVACRPPADTRTSGEIVTGPWEIREGAVGPVTVDAPLPAALLEGAGERYFARYIADGQPFEGFSFAEQGVDVAISGGPFAAWDRRSGPGEPPTDELRDAAARKARGAKVSAIVVRGDAARTGAGAGAGSTLTELQDAHGEAKLRPLPPTFGDDLCSAWVDGLPGVSFVFASCDAAREGEPILRVDLWGAR